MSCRTPYFPPQTLPSGASTSDYQQQILAAIQLLVSTSAPLPNGAATDAKSEAIRALLAGTLTVTDTNSAAIQGVEALAIGNNGTPRRSVGCLCTAEGNATFVLADNSTLALPMYVGWQTFPFAVKQVSAFTGTGSFYNLK